MNRQSLSLAAFIVAVALPLPRRRCQGRIALRSVLTYCTGAFAGSGIPVANGMHDYLTMMNERDGGIGGVKIEIEECETGYTAEKGVECCEKTKAKKPLVYNPYSTAITLQLIPKAPVDKVPLLSMAYGLSASAVGKNFAWVFNPPTTYGTAPLPSSSTSPSRRVGSTSSRARKSGFIHLDAGYGKELDPSAGAVQGSNMASSFSFIRCRRRRCRTSRRSGSMSSATIRTT